MAKVVLAGLEFHGYHGVHPEEARFGARFRVDVEMDLPDPDDDAVEATVDYSAVYAFVQDEVTGRRYRLIETLAARLADGLIEQHARLTKVLVRVHKPHAPLPGVVQDVVAEVVRRRA